MTKARLLVTLPDGLWKADVSKRHPETTFRVHASVLDDEVGYELVIVSGPAVAECVSEIEAHPDVAAVSSLGQTDEEATIQVESATPPILLAAKESGLPIEYPVEIRDGEAMVDATGSHARLSALGERFRDAGLRFEVVYVQHEHRTGQLLTEKQRELLFAAVEHGYYETPRRCTLTELADRVGLAKSTCSETLHRVEETVVEYFVRDVPAARPADEQPADEQPATT